MKRNLLFAGLFGVGLLSLLALGAANQQKQDCCGHVAAVAAGEAPQQQQPQKKKYGRGRVEPKNLNAIHAAAKQRHGDRMTRLPKATAPNFDAVAMGWVCPVLDQGNCGSCWDFSGSEMATSAFIKAGLAPNDGSFILSPQYTLDCYANGGCNGDDNTTVLIHAKAIGLPTEKDYGQYVGYSQRCQFKSGTQLYQISDWGFCTPNQQDGVAAVQDIKNALVQYGAIGCAVAADDAFSNYQAGTVFDRTTSTSIDHDVMIVGWDDSKGSKGAWKVQNSWSASWGDQGYLWMGYGVNLIGTEAVWCTVVAPTPPPPPPPPPPPTPPVPPPPTPPGPVPPMPSTAHIYLPSAFPAGVYPIGPAMANSAELRRDLMAKIIAMPMPRSLKAAGVSAVDWAAILADLLGILEQFFPMPTPTPPAMTPVGRTPIGLDDSSGLVSSGIQLCSAELADGLPATPDVVEESPAWVSTTEQPQRCPPQGCQLPAWPVLPPPTSNCYGGACSLAGPTSYNAGSCSSGSNSSVARQGRFAGRGQQTGPVRRFVGGGGSRRGGRGCR